MQWKKSPGTRDRWHHQVAIRWSGKALSPDTTHVGCQCWILPGTAGEGTSRSSRHSHKPSQPPVRFVLITNSQGQHGGSMSNPSHRLGMDTRTQKKRSTQGRQMSGDIATKSSTYQVPLEIFATGFRSKFFRSHPCVTLENHFLTMPPMKIPCCCFQSWSPRVTLLWGKGNLHTESHALEDSTSVAKLHAEVSFVKEKKRN